MLIKYKATNYKSIHETLELNMLKNKAKKELEDNTIKYNYNNKILDVLSTSVIYGPNASGKSNIIFSLDTLKSIILRGNILNTNLKTFNSAASFLELIPNIDLKKQEPTEFEIQFIHSNLLIIYHLSLDLGICLNEEYKRKIIYESLNVNGKDYFIRTDEVIIKNSAFENKDKAKEILFINKIVKESLSTDSLFLTNGFKTIINTKLANKIIEFFNDYLIVIDNASLSKNFSKQEFPFKFYKVEEFDDVAKVLTDRQTNIVYIKNDETQTNERNVLLKTAQGNYYLSLEEYESLGTLKFLNLFPFLLGAMTEGKTIIIDEFDASIHPFVLMNIINIFHNNEVNLFYSQLIFSTHNPIFLNNKIMRRDEIKFVEYDVDKKTSLIYSLADFRTDGQFGVRDVDDYMRDYFKTKYGAIKWVDFEPFFEKAINRKLQNVEKN